MMRRPWQIRDPARHAERLHHGVRGSTLRLVSGFGHSLHRGAPGLVVEATPA
jgi:hypothetical protein